MKSGCVGDFETVATVDALVSGHCGNNILVGGEW